MNIEQLEFQFSTVSNLLKVLESKLESIKSESTFKLSDYPNVRLGYACINETIKKTCSVNKSCIEKTFREKGVDYAITLARQNLKNVLTILKWNEKNDIRLYRMSSSMFPHLTNPKVIPKGSKYAYPLDQFQDICTEIGAYCKKHKHRITFHPGQFNQIGSPTPTVFENTSLDLSAHADLLDMMGIGSEGVLVVHGGGTYGDKEKTLKRWVEQFDKLPLNVQNRIVIENCERCYNVTDMLELSKLINRPVVFDTHHHKCYNEISSMKLDQRISLRLTPLDIFSKKSKKEGEMLEDVLKTWKTTTPKFHISEQDLKKRIGAHSDYVECIPDYLIDLIKRKGPSFKLDLMIEAKKKELSVIRLRNNYK